MSCREKKKEEEKARVRANKEDWRQEKECLEERETEVRKEKRIELS